MLDAPIKTRVEFVRHEDDEWYDEVTIRVVERWKESELSGDEWRFSYFIEFKRKGHTVLSRTFSRLPWALAHVPALGLADMDEDEHAEAITLLRDFGRFCAQPGCQAEPTREFRILVLYEKGSGAAAYMSRDTDYRFRFCAKHGTGRGDCGLQDSDANLVEVAFGAPADAPALGGD
jgi:hypothetical protein